MEGGSGWFVLLTTLASIIYVCSVLPSDDGTWSVTVRDPSGHFNYLVFKFQILIFEISIVKFSNLFFNFSIFFFHFLPKIYKIASIFEF